MKGLLEGQSLFLKQREVKGGWPALGRHLEMEIAYLVTWSDVIQIAFVSRPLKNGMIKYDDFLRVRKMQKKVKLSEMWMCR